MDLQLHAVIKRELKSRGLSLNELSKATGIATSSLHNWITKRPPSGKNLPQLHRLSEYLGLSLSALIFDVSDGDSKSKILFRSEFLDGEHRYRLIIEKIES